MKQLIFLALICFFCNTQSHGQCVIYACDNTGAFGAGFNDDNKPTTYEECKVVAVKGCKDHGGTDCTLLYQSSKKGWWGIINGKKSDGRNYFQGGDGYASKSDAESAIRRKYIDGGGVNGNSIPVTTWYSYSNLKY